MPVRIVQSKQNARLKELRRALASPSRAPGGLAGIEGPNLIAEALNAGLRFRCVFVAQGSEQLLETLPLAPQTEVLLLPRELLDSALTTESPQPIAALVELPDWTWEHLVPCSNQPPPLLVVLAGLQDPGNLGAVLRSAEAFGANGVLSLPGTVSAWNPKAVRASTGSVFRVPLLAVTAEECFARLRAAGVKILAASVRNAEPVHLSDLTGPSALLIGNEGNGLPPELAARADAAITILCPGPVESLNAAVAAGVLLYEVSRQRFAQPPSARAASKHISSKNKSRSPR
jgi:TrmH family RNA methyltransferase